MPDTTETAAPLPTDAGPGLCERSYDSAAVEAPEGAAAGTPSGVFFVQVRPAREGWRFLPPLAIIALGVGFLTYRARSSDWQGLALNLPTSRRLTSSPPPGPTPTPATTEVSRPAEVSPPPTAPTAVAGPTAAPEPVPPAATPAPAITPETPAAPRAAPDPLDDIRREAEATRRRTEELERLKAEQGRKLDESAAEREFADRLDHPQRGRGLKRLPRNPGADDLELVFEAHRREFRRQMERMTEIHRRQMESMGAMEREFFNGRQSPGPRPGFGFGFGFGPTAPGGMGVPNPPRGLQGSAFPPVDGQAPTLRIYRGTGVSRGGETIWSFRPADGRDTPPPTPTPVPKRSKAAPPVPERPDREV